MMRRLSLLPWVLCTLFAVTSVTMASARGMVATGEAMVICSGYGVVTIMVDDKGEPVGTVHPCPECVAQLLVALPQPAVTMARPATPGRTVAPRPVAASVAFDRMGQEARAPPVV